MPQFLADFINLHPFFVHLPLALIPTAALLVWLGRKVRSDGFDTATLLIGVLAALGAVTALLSGWQAEDTLPHNRMLHELMERHETNAIVVTVTACAAALLHIAEWRGWLAKKFWWMRAGILSFSTVGILFTGHMGATLVYVHGAAVTPVAELAKRTEAAKRGGAVPEPPTPPTQK